MPFVSSTEEATAGNRPELKWSGRASYEYPRGTAAPSGDSDARGHHHEERGRFWYRLCEGGVGDQRIASARWVDAIPEEITLSVVNAVVECALGDVREAVVGELGEALIRSCASIRTIRMRLSNFFFRAPTSSHRAWRPVRPGRLSGNSAIRMTAPTFPA